MHLKQIKQKVPKNRTNEKDLSNNKLKKNKITKESIEFKKIYILSPTINIANKQCYIFEPLKTDLPPKKSIKIINFNKEYNNRISNQINNILKQYRDIELQIKLNQQKAKEEYNQILKKQIEEREQRRK